METDIDIQSDMGHFGWEELFGGFVIPFIVRENRKFCSLDIFNKDVARDFHCNLNDDDLRKFDDLQTYSLTEIESYLMNEINHFHCDSLYEHSFKSGDTLIELNDISRMTKFFHDLRQKLIHGEAYDLKNCGILNIRIKKNDGRKEYVVPYVRINHTRYVPINKCVFYSGTPKRCVKLTDINLQYMKFMYKVLGLIVNNIGECMPLEEIRERMKVYEYWPEKDLCDRFYPSTEPIIRTFSVSDNSSTGSQHNLQFSCDVLPTSASSDMPTTSQDMPTLNPTIPTPKQRMSTSSIPINEQQQIMTINESQTEPNEQAVDRSKTKNVKFDENGNESSASTNRSTKKRDKTTTVNDSKKSKEKNKKRSNTSSKQTKKKMKRFSTPSGEYYPIERILDRKVDSAGNILCLVRWQNYSPSHDSWEPFANFTDDIKIQIESNTFE